MLATFGPGPGVLAFDIGGTFVKSAVVDPDGRVLDVRRDVTARDRFAPAEVVARQLGAIARTRIQHSGATPVVAGVSVPGIVDEERGRAVYSANLGWRDAPLRDLAADEIGLPVAFGHDVRGAGAVEMHLGAGRDRKNALIVTIGTGIAATVVVDGRVHAGGGYAGEIGHLPTVPDGDECGCGRRGCLETVASAAAIARRFSERSGEHLAQAAQVHQRLAAGDPVARAVWDEATAALSVQLQRLCIALGPEVVVLSGGLSAAGEDLLEPLRRGLADLPDFLPRPEVLQSALGPDAGLLGAALAARRLATETGALRA